MREQKGYVWRKGNAWFLRYWDSTVENGVVVRKQRGRKLADVSKEHLRLKRPPQSVLDLAEDVLRPINQSSADPSKNVTIGDFAKNVWLPFVENRAAASTAHSHRYYWEHTLLPWCGQALLRDFSTPAAQRLLDELARHNPGMKKATLHKLKSILSALFKLAIQQGYRPGPNPIRETSLPRAPEADETFAYDLETVLAMLRLVPEPSRTVIAVAAFSGLRRGEIEGLTWEAYDGETVSVLRAMWQGIAGEPKSRKSKAAVPVIAALKLFLDQHRARCGNQAGIMFRTGTGTPLSMNNLLNDQIRPAIEKCLHCGISKSKHEPEDRHAFERNPALPEWHGFHAFRRGLATNLHDLGVDDLTIQRILRHSDVSVTQRCYIKTLPEQSIAAMRKLEQMVSSLDAFSALCNDHATEGTDRQHVN